MSQIRRGIPARSLKSSMPRIVVRRSLAVTLVLIGIGSSLVFAAPQWHEKSTLPLVAISTIENEEMTPPAPLESVAADIEQSADSTASADVAASEPLSIAPAANSRSEPRFNGRPVRPARTMTMTVTGYSPDERSCGASADNITASGYSVWTNGGKMVAADTRLLPFGALVSIPGYDRGSPVPVLDRGGKIKGHRLDLLFPTHEAAREWGVRKIEVTVWEYADSRGPEKPARQRR